MPNGGSDNCGTCFFNRKNRKETDENKVDNREKDFCIIRNIPIECSFWTYCSNHQHHNPDRIDIPIGPVYVCKENSYGRVVSIKSSDREEIRLKLIELAEKMKEQPAEEYSAGVYLDEAIVMQLGEFREKKAKEALLRILDFDPQAGVGRRTRGSLIKTSLEALDKIECLTESEEKNIADMFIEKGLINQEQLDKGIEEEKNILNAIIKYINFSRKARTKEDDDDYSRFDVSWENPEKVIERDQLSDSFEDNKHNYDIIQIRSKE